MKSKDIMFGILLIIIIITVSISGCVQSSPIVNADEITNFDECLAAGYPAMESYPRQCAVPGGETFTEKITSGANIANPASVYCEQNGGVFQAYETDEGTIGYCAIPDGRVCEEWVYFNSDGTECTELEG
ncbi:MAG: DUF333 domain-containing protein [Candidatus Peribacteraceae bacterium]|nr:DUF333 domain-containing protein [Candidatus Peribacteraceae bacterium]